MTTTAPLRSIPGDTPAAAPPSAAALPQHAVHPVLRMLLEHRGVATAAQIAGAAERSRVGGTSLPAELVAGGAEREDVYRVLATFWAAAHIDESAEPCDPELLRREPVPVQLARGWIPWAMRDGVLVIATSVPPTPGLLAEAGAVHGVAEVEPRTISDRRLEGVLAAAQRDELRYRITDAHADAHPRESARQGLAWWQKALPLTLIVTAIVAGVLWPATAVVAIFFAANAAFYVFVMFKTYLGLRTPMKVMRAVDWQRVLRVERRRAGVPVPLGGDAVHLDESALPSYTILVPVYREANIIGKLVGNLGRLEYPASKLQVLLLLEEDDHETIQAAIAANPPAHVAILTVPDGQPRTKPRACNYGLEFARGDYVVIFDAEDKPDPRQLRTAVAAFELNAFIREHVDPAEPQLACVQAALGYFNAEHNVLTRLFAIEYAHWFDAMLPGMDGTGIPIPLGGTSNHFRTTTLRELGGWDPYNVTEDADLGMRISNRGYAVTTIHATTREEACAEVRPWIRQRTRWIKGYSITAAVNLRHAPGFLRRNGIGGAMSLGLLIAGTPLAFMLYPVSILFTLVTWLGVEFGEFRFPVWVLQASVLVMVFGMSTLIASSGIAAWRRYGWRVAVYAPLLPAYWLLHSIAAWRAGYQAIFDPHHWEKTPHGLTHDHDEHEAGGAR